MSIILNLPPELESRLDALARDTDKTREDYLVDALERYLEELENYNEGVRSSGLVKGERMGTFAADALRSDLELGDPSSTMRMPGALGCIPGDTKGESA